MTLQVLLIDSEELRRLISTPATGVPFVTGTIKCAASVELIFEVEHTKKRLVNSHSVLQNIKGKACRLHDALKEGYLHTAALDTAALKCGLFETSEDFSTVSLWEPAVDRRSDPLRSVRLVSLRSYDIDYGTEFHTEIAAEDVRHNDD